MSVIRRSYHLFKLRLQLIGVTIEDRVTRGIMNISGAIHQGVTGYRQGRGYVDKTTPSRYSRSGSRYSRRH